MATGSFGIYETLRPNTISDRATKDGLTLLNTKSSEDSSTNSDDNDWKTKVSSWKEGEGEGVAKYIEKNPKPIDETKKVSALKKRCKKALKETYEEKKYEDFKSYCTKNQS